MEELPKQWIILRKDLNCRKGKLIAQGAHASMKAIFQGIKEVRPHVFELDLTNKESVEQWLTGTFTKIALSVDSEEQLMEIYNRALSDGILCALIEDNGLTEFHGVVTKTAISIGPALPSEVFHLVGELKLL